MEFHGTLMTTWTTAEINPATWHWLLVWSGVLAAAALLGGVVAMLLRRRMLEADGATNPAGFTLADLRKMRDLGELTEDEFQAAKSKLLARVRGEPQEKGEGAAGEEDAR